LSRIDSIAGRLCQVGEDGDADRGFVIFERFRNLGGRLFYYTLAELEALCTGAFERVALSVPTYPGGARFPRLALRARG